MQDFVWQQKTMTDNSRHGEHQTPPSISYLWAGAKKSATINDSGFRCRGTPLLAEMERFELSLRFCRTTAFRVRTLQPLGYISLCQLYYYTSNHKKSQALCANLSTKSCSATIDIGQKFRKKKREIGKNLIE